MKLIKHLLKYVKKYTDLTGLNRSEKTRNLVTMAVGGEIKDLMIKSQYSNVFCHTDDPLRIETMRLYGWDILLCCFPFSAVKTSSFVFGFEFAAIL